MIVFEKNQKTNDILRKNQLGKFEKKSKNQSYPSKKHLKYERF